MQDDLRRCPFDRGKAIIVFDPSSGTDGAFLGLCLACSATGQKAGTREAARTLWNTRTEGPSHD